MHGWGAGIREHWLMLARRRGSGSGRASLTLARCRDSGFGKSVSDARVVAIPGLGALPTLSALLRSLTLNQSCSLVGSQPALAHHHGLQSLSGQPSRPPSVGVCGSCFPLGESAAHLSPLHSLWLGRCECKTRIGRTTIAIVMMSE